MPRRWDEPAQSVSDEPDWAEHEELAGDLAAAVRPFSARSELYSPDHAAAVADWIAVARSEPPEVTRSLLFLLIRRSGEEGGWSHDASWRVHGLRRLRCTVRARDAAYVLRTAAGLPDTWWASDVLACASALAARADDPDDWRLVRALAGISASVREREYVTAADRAQITRALSRLRPRPGKATPVDTSVICASDGWSAAVLAEFSRWDGQAQPVNLLLHHLRSAPRTRVTKKWLAEATVVLEAPDARLALRVLLQAVVCAEGAKAPDRYGWGLVNLVVSGHNADLVCAAVWASSALDEEWVVPTLADVARRSIHGTSESGYVESATVWRGCAASLGLIGSAAAICALEDLLGGTVDALARRQLSAALSAAASRAGLCPGEVAERVVSRAGLDAGGERTVAVGGVTAQVRLTDDGGTQVRWRGKRRWVRRPPTDSADAERAVRLIVREVSEAVAGERSRLEGLLAQDRGWQVAQWRRLYCEHPVTGSISRGLVWAFEVSGGAGLTGIPSADGRLVTPDGVREVPPEARVRLWHPVRASAEEVAAWRAQLGAAGGWQPFEQAFREVYRLTAAERESAAYSDRFAGRVLRYQRLYGLLGERGWTVNYLDPYGGGSAGRACLSFPDARLTAVFEHHATGAQPGDLQLETCQAGRVTFCRAGDRSARPVRLDKVPDLVFTEAMRDLGLVISLTTT